MIIIYKNSQTDRFDCYEENRADCIVCFSKEDVYKRIEECISKGDEIDMFITSYKYERAFKKWFREHNLSTQFGIIYKPDWWFPLTPVIIEANRFLGKKYHIISTWHWRWGAKSILSFLNVWESDLESSDCVIYGNKPTWLETVNPDLERAYEINKDSDKIEIISEDEFLKSVYPPEDNWPKGFWINNGVLFKYTGLDKSVTIPDGVWHINEDAFFNNVYAEEIIIPNSVRSIGKNAFTGCDELKEITIPDSVVSMDSCFVSCKKLKRVKLSSNEEKIAGGCFIKCKALEEVIIPEGVRRIGGHAFENCIGLRKINLPSTLLEIGWDAFRGCKNLLDINIPNSIIAINSNAFNECSESLRHRIDEFKIKNPHIKEWLFI